MASVAIPLDALDPSETRFGGKAAGLAWLARRARVPAGLAIAADAPEDALLDARTRARLELLLEQGPVAVRSSAVGEDGAVQSFAGQFDTVLGARDLPAVEAAFAAVRASARAPRAMAAAGRTLPMGVVIQAMVAPIAAGVLFTIDPRGEDPASVLEAVPGLGEGLVSGHAEPARWRVYLDGRGQWITRGGPALAGLDERQVIALVAAGRALATARGAPLDLEWAIDAQGPVWLQARPITAARPWQPWPTRRAAPEADDGPVIVWSNFNVRETAPDPMTPLSGSLWRDVLLPLVSAELMGAPRELSRLTPYLFIDQVAGRLYWNMNGLIASPAIGPLLLRMLHHIDGEAASTLQVLVADGVLRPRRYQGSTLGVRLGMMAASLRGAARASRALLPRRALASLRRWAAEVDARPPLDTLSDAALVAELRLPFSPIGRRLFGAVQWMSLSLLAYAACEALFRGHADALGLLAAGVPDNPTTQIGAGIDALVEAARPIASLFLGEEPGQILASLRAAGPDTTEARWLGELDRFLARDGQRCASEFELSGPRWAEDPAPILALVTAALRAPREPTGARLARLAEARRAAIDAAIQASPRWRRPLMRALSDILPAVMPLREAPKHEAMRLLLRMRRAAIVLGTRMAARGQLEAPEQIFLLELAELDAVARGDPPAELPTLLATRAEAHARACAEAPPDWLRSDGVPVPAPERPGEPGLLRGLPIAGGRVVGRARHLSTPDAARVSPGDILVVAFADPGWTPLFGQVSGVIMEVGGGLCHAAVVARELVVPAVFGVRGALAAIPDGAAIELDGRAGTVRLLGQGALA